MLPAKFRGFASRVGRLASRALAWHKTSERDGAVRTSHTLRRALFAMLVAAATLLAMLILPPVNKAKGFDEDRNTNPYPQVWWDGMGSGYVVGKGVTYNEGGKTYHPAWNAYNSISLPNAYIDQANRKIVWSFLIMKDSELYKSLKYNRPIDGNRSGEGRAAIMAFLPKGIDLNSVKIYRRRTGKTKPRVLENDLTITKEDGSRRTYRRGTQISYGCFAHDDAWDSQNFGQYVRSNDFTVYPGNRNCSQLDPKIHVGETISSFTGGRWNTNQANTDANKVAEYFDEAVSSMRLGDCKDEDNNGTGMCTVRHWKSNFAASLMSWEDRNLRGYEWHITATYNENVKHPELLPLLVGYSPNKTVGTWGDDNGKWAFMGPLDYDGDGIPDKVEHDMGTNPVEKTSLLYPKYDAKMLPDYIKKLKNQTGASAYGGISNVPVTVFGTNAVLKPYVETGEWVGASGTGHFTKHKDETTSDLHLDDLPGTNMEEPLNEGNRVKYTLSNIPTGIKRNDYGECDVNTVHGCVNINYQTGVITYNPRKEDIGNEVTFTLSVRHPNSNIFPYKCSKNNQDGAWTETQQVKIKVVSQASIYNPQYSETVVHNIKTNKGFYTVGTADSAAPTSVANPHAKNPSAIYTGPLPAGTTFSIPDDANHKNDRYKIDNEYVGDHKLQWSSMGNSKTGSVHFAPTKMDAGTSAHTPVVVTYPDGSTSEDVDAGNAYYSNNKIDKAKSVVYAPVKVDDLQVTDGDLHLDLKDGTQINNGQFGGWSFGDANKPKELSKGTKIGAPKENKNNGIVLDSWSTNAKGPITFRAVCHKKNDTKYKLLKPAEGKNKASGDINGLQFEEFRQWERGNDKNCKDKNTCNLNKYLHNTEYNNDTMERSRALIGGKPKEGGEYECKVFAFHQAHDGKGTQHNQALTQFDTLAKNNGAGFAFAFDTGAFASSKGKEWVSGNFYFKIKLKDNQKYNPTYVKIPEIKAGTFANKEYNSSDQPKSQQHITVNGKKVNANGVPDKDLGGVEDNKDLPKGTWFSIKKLVKKVDKTQPDKFPTESELWSNFEGGEDNVKRDNSGKPVMEKGKVVPLNETGREYGSVTFRPDKWKDAGQYWAEVVVHYPDGSASSDDDSINYKHPVYAKVNVTRDDAHNQFGLALYKNYPNTLMDNGYDLKVDKSLPNDATFDSWLTKSVGPIHLHMICSKKAKEGNSGTKTKQTEYTYNRLPGHDETNGLRLKKQTIWGHATFEQQKSCIKDNACKPDTLLYDDWVPGGNSNNTAERTRGFFGGKAQKTGDYECKVYAIKGDQKKSDAFKKAVEANIEKNKKDKKDVDPVPSVLNAKGNPYGTEGVGYKTGSFEVRIHNDNQLYNPTYTTIPEIEAGSTYNAKKAAISSGAPQSKKKVTEGSAEVNANGVSDYDLQNVKEGALPKGTWYEIKRFVKASDISKTSAKSLPWANFEDGEDNKADGKQEAKDSNATNKGSVTFRPDKWQDADEYWAEIRVHYPDGTTSDGEGSINKDHPIYAKVKVTRPAIDSGDLHLNVYKQYENGKFTGYVDDVNGITVMKGVGLLKDMGIDSWSTAKPEGITLRALCRDDSDEAKKSTTHIWSENLDNLFFKLNWQKSWDHADFQKQETCRKSGKKGDGCNPEGKYLLFDSTGGTMERASGTITSDKAPTKSGKYYCVVLAMKLTDLGKYKKAIKNSKISVTNNNFAKAMGFTDTEGIDWTAKYFPVTVVEKFALPKTGGDGLSMALLVVAMIGMCVMCGAFFVDQTKWGHAMLVGAAGAAVSAAAGMMRGLRGATQNSNSNRNSKISEIWRGLVKKVKDIRRFDDYSASVKDFVRKATGWLRAALRRVGRWAAERWRC
ncbi:Rib/alpha-like domain-containing protein [Gardnerella greenwoodii]|uniref:Rib/alpha-like domain-containing protein n=1 Tax=Gardnerella greenwoodii TaxID=2914925 RepID=UPI0039706A3B